MRSNHLIWVPPKKETASHSLVSDIHQGEKCMYGIGLKEATNGKYYVAKTGICLHVDPYCQYVYHMPRGARVTWLDETNTLSYRVKRAKQSGEKMIAPTGKIIVGHCWVCTVDHWERREMNQKSA